MQLRYENFSLRELLLLAEREDNPLAIAIARRVFGLDEAIAVHMVEMRSELDLTSIFEIAKDTVADGILNLSREALDAHVESALEETEKQIDKKIEYHFHLTVAKIIENQ